MLKVVRKSKLTVTSSSKVFTKSAVEAQDEMVGQTFTELAIAEGMATTVLSIFGCGTCNTMSQRTGCATAREELVNSDSSCATAPFNVR